MKPSPFGFLRSRPAQILSAVLILQAGLYYAKAKTTERVPLVQPLEAFPKTLESFRFLQEGVVEQEVRDVLKADEILNRTYAEGSRPIGLNLFIAYFKSQRTGVRPHSPKNCLPGSGWTPTSSTISQVPIAARGISIPVNRYLVSKGESKHLVLYWYHSHNRAIASEYEALAYSILDSVRYNRSDTSIVRVVVPVIENDETKAEESALRFVQAIYPHLENYFPG